MRIAPASPDATAASGARFEVCQRLWLPRGEQRRELRQCAEYTREPQEVVEGDPSGAFEALHRVAGYTGGLGKRELSQAAPKAPSAKAACELECDGGRGERCSVGF